MNLKDKNVGLAITGSFCNFSNVKSVIESLKKENANVIPIVSEITKSTTTRFFEHKKFLRMLEEETENKIIDSIVLSEPIGPKDVLDILLICPCTRKHYGKIKFRYNRYDCTYGC